MAEPLSDRITAAMHKEAVGQNLADARKALGLTQAEMARKYRMKQNKLSQWESGLYYPEPWFLTQLCNDHGFTMDWFYRRVRSGVSVARADDLRRVEGGASVASQARGRPVSEREHS